MIRNVLLIEPNYKNKYPPIGLMKLATYHRSLGDNVVFFKGELENLIIDQIYNDLLIKLYDIEKEIFWEYHKQNIVKYIKVHSQESLKSIIKDTFINAPLIIEWLKYYSDYFRNKKYEHPENRKWDRICVATLFTFHWDITIKTIQFAKQIIKDENELWVGGVCASMLQSQIKKITGIKNVHFGLLDTSGILDNNDIIIDNLPLDYSILDEIDYQYPESSAYYSYMTRGCKRKCSFCAVWKIEPEFKHHVKTVKENFNYIKNRFGEQQNLLLLDNNVLFSEDFETIIKEIKELGFKKGAKYIEPNLLDISVKNLSEGINDKAYIRKTYKLFHLILHRLKGENAQKIYNLFEQYHLLKLETSRKENILIVYPQIADLYPKIFKSKGKLRYVDFNQGIDARLITNENAKLLSQISIKPVRIAFDSLTYEKHYVNAIKNCAKHGIKNFSNYLLYNHDETPSDFFERMKINTDLSEKLNVKIFSFPMKFLPIKGEKSFERNYIGEHWNRKFIRAVQAVLNATAGKVGHNRTYFEKAFGKNLDEFLELLYLPEDYLIYRFFYEHLGYTQQWKKVFYSLTNNELIEVKTLIEKLEFDNTENSENENIVKVLKHYKNILDKSPELQQLKKEYDLLMKNKKVK